MFSVVDEVAVDTAHGRVYEHGWQSWSPTATYDLTTTSTRPQLGWQHVMRFRPETPAPRRGFQAEGLLVLEPVQGGPAWLYAAPDPSRSVPSIRAELRDGHMVVSADGPVTSELVTTGRSDALAAVADGWALRLRAQPLRPAPTVWCSWYHYFEGITEMDLLENLEAITRHDLPVDVVQVDDGWQAGVGDWQRLSDRFSSLEGLAGRIHDAGRRAGIWLAPFTVGWGSALARQHPDWLVGEGGANWGQSLHGLDLTHPAARDYVRTVLERLVAAGFDYLKLDFLYTGALPGRRHADVEPVAAYRSGLQLVRDTVGAEVFLVGCGAPILPSVGLLDAMRVSPDVYNPTDTEPGSARLRGEQGTVNRSWQHGRFWVNDPDCLIARPSFTLREEWAGVIERFGGLRGSSDRIADLDAWGLETTRRLLAAVPPPAPFPVADR